MREVGKMNWVGESQGCPEAIKAPGVQMGCLLETGLGVVMMYSAYKLNKQDDNIQP